MSTPISLNFSGGLLTFTISRSFVETKDRTLEEINEIFAADNPVKTSLKKHIIIVTETEQFLQDYIPGGEQDAAAATELQHFPPNKATDT